MDATGVESLSVCVIEAVARSPGVKRCKVTTPAGSVEVESHAPMAFARKARPCAHDACGSRCGEASASGADESVTAVECDDCDDCDGEDGDEMGGGGGDEELVDGDDKDGSSDDSTGDGDDEGIVDGDDEADASVESAPPLTTPIPDLPRIHKIARKRTVGKYISPRGYVVYWTTDAKQARLCCHADGCIDAPLFGFQDDRRATMCQAHCMDGMVIRGLKCPCGKHMHFGFPGDERPSACVGCKQDGMVNITSPKCPCGKQTTFGFPGDKRPSAWCRTSSAKAAVAFGESSKRQGSPKSSTSTPRSRLIEPCATRLASFHLSSPPRLDPSRARVRLRVAVASL